MRSCRNSLLLAFVCSLDILAQAKVAIESVPPLLFVERLSFVGTFALVLGVIVFVLTIPVAIIAPGFVLRVLRRITHPPRFLGGAYLLLLGVIIVYVIYPSVYLGLFINSIFQKEMNVFLSADHDQLVEPYIKGKILIIDKAAHAVDVWQLGLPESLRARKPEEVGTIVWLEDSESLVGHYVVEGTTDRRGSGFARVVEISIVDRSLNAVINRRRVVGAAPPKTSSGGDQHGSYPADEIRQYIYNLQTLRRL